MREQGSGLCGGSGMGFRQQEGLSGGRQKTKGYKKDTKEERPQQEEGRTEWGVSGNWKLERTQKHTPSELVQMPGDT